MVDIDQPNPYVPSSETEALAFGTPGQAASVSTLKGYARIGQMITFALTQGIIVIAGVFLFITVREDQEVAAPQVYMMIGAGAFAMSLVAGFLVPSLIRSQAMTQFRRAEEVVQMRSSSVMGDPNSQLRDEWIQWEADKSLPLPLNRLLAANQTSTLVGQAVLEGAAIINLVFFLLNGTFLHLILAAMCIVGILSMVPTVSRLRSLVARGVAPDR